MVQGMRHTVGTFCQKEGSLLQPQPAEGSSWGATIQKVDYSLSYVNHKPSVSPEEVGVKAESREDWSLDEFDFCTKGEPH